MMWSRNAIDCSEPICYSHFTLPPIGSGPAQFCAVHSSIRGRGQLMKPAPFDYLAPASLDEALEILAQRGDEAKVLAGGQSLVPLLNLRLARPALLVDLNRLSDLAYVRTDDGVV